jgi:hypothetical protein
MRQYLVRKHEYIKPYWLAVLRCVWSQDYRVPRWIEPFNVLGQRATSAKILMRMICESIQYNEHGYTSLCNKSHYLQSMTREYRMWLAPAKPGTINAPKMKIWVIRAAYTHKNTSDPHWLKNIRVNGTHKTDPTSMWDQSASLLHQSKCVGSI